MDICEIGKSIVRIDGIDKAIGKLKYAADFYENSMLWIEVKRALIPHAKILNIDIKEALQIKGVRKILTAKDIKGTNLQGVAKKDQPVLAGDIIKHRGDAIAIIIAETREAAKLAKQKIKLEIEKLKPIFSIGSDNKDVLIQGEIKVGENVNKIFEKCDVIVESEFELPVQEHAYLETETGWAIFKNGILEITVSTQTPFRDKMEVAEALGIPVKNVRIIAPYCGGAFGGKDGITVQTILGLAAMNVPNTPVKILLEREESFIAGVKRHRAKIYYKIGANRDGKLKALYADIKYDTGPYDHLGGVVMALGLEHAGGAYKIPNSHLVGKALYTNNPIGGAFRGFGVPQVNACIEQIIDMIAEKTGINPIEIRRKNILKKGDKNAIGVNILTSLGIDECLKVLESHEFWKNREQWKAEVPIFKKRGVGIACAIHGIGYGPKVPDVANAKIELTSNGKFKVYCGVVDMGQGNIPTYLQIAGNILNQNLDNLIPVLPDTDKTLPSGSSSASRTTFTFGNALIKAAKILKQRIIEKTADILMEENPENLELIEKNIIHLPTGKKIKLTDIAKFFNDSERIAVARYRAPISKEDPTKDENLKLHGIPHYIFSTGVHLAGVEIDSITGEITLKKYIVISDCGRLINPQIFEQQVHGGVVQGIGYGMFEDMKIKEGKILTEDFSTYILPTALDIPDIESFTVEIDEKFGPYGLKGAGEVAIDAPLPAVANAVFDACKVRIKKFPITAEKILIGESFEN